MLDNCWYLARYANQSYHAMKDTPKSEVQHGCRTISGFLKKEFSDDR